MKNIISGETADDCLVKTLKILNWHGYAAPPLDDLSDEICRFPHPSVICLTNPLARFSFFPRQDPRMGIAFGLCALAGVNTDDILTTFGKLYKPFLPGPYFRGFNSEMNPYRVDLKNAGTRIGSIDQLAEAVEFLKKNPQRSFIVSLRDPRKTIDNSGGAVVAMRFYSGRNNSLSASVYVPELNVARHLVSIVIPTYTFIQQMIAHLLGRELGEFYIITDEVYAEKDVSRALLEKSPPRIKALNEFSYQETKNFDFRYLDMAIQHIMDFVKRVRCGDLLVQNPFENCGPHLEVFHDYGEAFRYGEAIDRGMSRDTGKMRIRHPQLAHSIICESFCK